MRLRYVIYYVVYHGYQLRVLHAPQLLPPLLEHPGVYGLQVPALRVADNRVRVVRNVHDKLREPCRRGLEESRSVVHDLEVCVQDIEGLNRDQSVQYGLLNDDKQVCEHYEQHLSIRGMREAEEVQC